MRVIRRKFDKLVALALNFRTVVFSSNNSQAFVRSMPRTERVHKKVTKSDRGKFSFSIRPARTSHDPNICIRQCYITSVAAHFPLLLDATIASRSDSDPAPSSDTFRTPNVFLAVSVVSKSREAAMIDVSARLPSGLSGPYRAHDRPFSQQLPRFEISSWQRGAQDGPWQISSEPAAMDLGHSWPVVE